ncbi:MAG: hypothetical protein R3253_16665 [Longimicrobiales bacterium]|nr:hypothetical protein [Longimicrobiales bacterium]
MARRTVRAAVAGALALAVLAMTPETAWACPVCFDSSDENRMAFLATTAFLSLLPLGMVAGAGLWLRKKSKERGEEPVDPNRPEP